MLSRTRVDTRRRTAVAFALTLIAFAVLPTGCGSTEDAYGALERAAQQGDAVAQYALGRMYHSGEGVPQDYAEALRWFNLSAEQGQAEAQYALGLMHDLGKGVPRDHAEAVRWFRLAAEQGQAVAQCLVGGMYATGDGVPQDDAESARWYRLAAEQGDVGGQIELGSRYIIGRGVPENHVLAHMWFSLAASSASDAVVRDLAVSGRKEMEKIMTPEQIAEAEQRAREWTENRAKEEAGDSGSSQD